jgi:hypothetical protein
MIDIHSDFSAEPRPLKLRNVSEDFGIHKRYFGKTFWVVTVMSRIHRVIIIEHEISDVSRGALLYSTDLIYVIIEKSKRRRAEKGLLYNARPVS